MGAFKPLLKLGQSTVIEHSLDSMTEAGIRSIVLVLGYRGAEIERQLGSKYAGRVDIVYNRDYETTDMLRSIQIGLQKMPPCDAFFILPGDMPGIKAGTYRAIRQCRAESGAPVCFPTVGGRRKHPPLVSFSLAGTIERFDGEGGLRSLWTRYENRIATVAVDDDGCETDLDTMADYRRFVGRESNGKQRLHESRQEASGNGYQ
jgi:CTP:molybdopterin cytidylyltransferase MocA